MTPPTPTTTAASTQGSSVANKSVSAERVVAAPLQQMFSSIQGEGPYVGVRQVFVRVAHCHLKCAYCDTSMTTDDGNWHVYDVAGDSNYRTLPNPVTSEAFLEAVLPILNASPHHSISFTGGEPLLYHRWLRQVMPHVRPYAKTYLETSGTQPALLAEVLPFTDIVAMDIKLPSTTGEAPQFEAHRAFYQVAQQSPHTELFAKLIVNNQTSAQELAEVVHIMTNRQAPVMIQPETCLTDDRVHMDSRHLLWICDMLLQHFPNTRVIPQTHKMLQVL